MGPGVCLLFVAGGMNLTASETETSNRSVVVFRKWKDTGDIIALFPLEASDVSGLYSNSYMHVGQHGSADAEGLVKVTVPASPTEYTPLKRELERIGYSLVVRKRIPHSSYATRVASVRRAA